MVSTILISHPRINYSKTETIRKIFGVYSGEKWYYFLGPMYDFYKINYQYNAYSPLSFEKLRFLSHIRVLKLYTEKKGKFGLTTNEEAFNNYFFAGGDNFFTTDSIDFNRNVKNLSGAKYSSKKNTLNRKITQQEIDNYEKRILDSTKLEEVFLTEEQLKKIENYQKIFQALGIE